ncbi:metal ABC transporter substrate-binding protein [Streptomyces sp. 8N616]|uniref:metal ABC transporter substrate-binding protein n=1 Tax=Streptomyces sp. 8N616 TaxID=3457414 RepID=UPI003FD1EF04
MNVRRRLIPTAAVAGAVTLGLTSLSACSGSGSGGGGNGGKLTVVASFYPMEYLAKEIGGDHVSVSDLTEPGIEPHDLELSPQQTAELGEAGMILYLKGLQPAVDEAVEQSGVKNTVDATTLTKLGDHGTEVGHDHGEEHGGEHGHEEEGDEHGAEDAGADVHVWLDPVKYAEIAEGVGKALEKADPDHADDYKKNTEALVGKLDGLNKEYEDGLKSRSTDTFITTHAAFGYLAERYGLDQEGIVGISDPESDPSPARMRELQTIAEKDKVTTVFFETIASPKTARTLASETGLKTDVLDPLEGITDKSQGDDYLEVMQANLKNLQKALGAK